MENKIVNVVLSVQEYYNVKAEAIKNNVLFNVKFDTNAVIFTTTASFLINLGFEPGFDF